MSLLNFSLPKGYKLLKEKYSLNNDQNLRFVCNLLSPCGSVITVFEAKESLETYDKMIKDYSNVTQNLQMKKKYNLKIGERVCPIYVIGKDTFLAQAFLEIRGTLYSFLSGVDTFGENYSQTKQNSPAFESLVNLLRAIK